MDFTGTARERREHLGGLAIRGSLAGRTTDGGRVMDKRET